MMRVLILDNYDSFTFNLYQYVGELGAHPLHYRNDKLTIEEAAEMRPDRILLSPGPGSPDDPAYFGVCTDAILKLGSTIPTLGICLGHQGIACAFGGRVVRAPAVMHGKSSFIRHDGSKLFASMPQPFEAMRYHSLIVEEASLPACLKVTARTEDRIIMALQHERYPIYGVQFHPESIGTPSGRQLLENFLRHG